MLIIVGEDADDFDQLRAELMDEHDPQSALECELVERLAGILWRLRRVPFFEAAILDARHAEVWANNHAIGRPSETEDEAGLKTRRSPTGRRRSFLAKRLLMMRAIAMRLESSRATRQP